ncbi:hypothetical protein KW787_01410 [Candidatus Pacearchaeota archaeon]|nr:hypothetical protein [Candidatus Pacearchaeota archaeon]
MKKILIIAGIFLALLLVQHVSALTVNSVTADSIAPGKEGTISVEVKNNADNDVNDVSFSLQLSNLPFTAVGSSEQGIDRINNDDEEDFSFILKASSDGKAGDYNIPYILTYKDSNDVSKEEKGTVGVSIIAQPELSFSVSQESPVLGTKDKITFKVVNKGLADAKFVNVKVFPTGYTLLSEDQVYLGTISSDDFQSASFDVLYTQDQPAFSALVEYSDFNNKKIMTTVALPLTAYTTEKAIQLGIIKKSNTLLYITILVVLIIIWLVVRSIRKRQRLKRSMQSS